MTRGVWLRKSLRCFFWVNTKDGRRIGTPSRRAFVYIAAPDIAIQRGVWGEKRRRRKERRPPEAQASSACCRACDGIFFAGNAYPNACIPAMQPAVCALYADISIITTIVSIHSTFDYSIMGSDIRIVVVVVATSS